MSNNENIFNGETDKIYKVIVVGAPAVGKRELVNNFSTDSLEEINLETIGASILKKSIKLKHYNVKVNLMFWDIAGQTQFYMLHRPYFNGADGMLLVFDLTRSSTFSNITNWYSVAVKYGLGGIPGILVVNNLHLQDERKIIIPMAEHLGEKLNAPYYEISTLTGENVNIVLEKIAELIYRAQVLDEKWKNEEEKNFSYRVRIEGLDKSRSGSSLCYLDQEIVEKMGLRTDLIEIQGKNITAGIVVSSKPDRGTGIIRLDELQRLNAGVIVGDYVSIKLVRALPAKEIELTPTTPNFDFKKLIDSILAKLIDKPVVSGNLVEILGTIAQKGDPDTPKRLGKLRLVVENTKPSNKVVKITRDTRIKVNKTPITDKNDL